MTFSNCGAFTWCGMFSSTTNIALGMSREIPRDAMFATRKYTTLMYISSSHGWACGGTCVIVGPQILRRRVLQSSYTLNQLHLILYPERPCSKYTPPPSTCLSAYRNRGRVASVRHHPEGHHLCILQHPHALSSSRRIP